MVIVLGGPEAATGSGLHEEISLLRDLNVAEKIVVFRHPLWFDVDDEFGQLFGVDEKERPRGAHLVVFDSDWRPTYRSFRAVRGLYSMYLDPAANLRRALNAVLRGRGPYVGTWHPSSLEYIVLIWQILLTALAIWIYYQAFVLGMGG